MKIIEHTAKNPLIVQQTINGHACSVAIPEGGSIGYDLDRVYCKNADNHWTVCLTSRSVFLKWLDDGYIKPRPLDQLSEAKKPSPTLAKKIKAFQSKEVKIEQPVYGDSI